VHSSGRARHRPRTIVSGFVAGARGEHWSRLASFPDTRLWDVALACGSATHCLFAGSLPVADDYGPASTVLTWATTDGGRWWRAQHPISDMTGLVGADCPSATTCVVVGEGLFGAPD
jgi:hypothetical protein